MRERSWPTTTRKAASYLTIPSVGLAFAAERSQLTKAQRKARGAELLLEHARRDPSFDGDFTALADRLGWNSGRRWQDNPAIRIATDRWQRGVDDKPGAAR